MRNRLVAACTAMGLLLSAGSALWAQEAVEYAFGTVKAVAEQEITLSEYDEAQDMSVDVRYSVGASTQIENVGSLADLAVGDFVEVDYVMQDGVRVAQVLYVDKQEAGSVE